MAEHDFMFSEATGSSGLSVADPNPLVDLRRSDERKKSESEDSEDEMRSISLAGCSYDLPNDYANMDRLESQINPPSTNRSFSSRNNRTFSTIF